MGYDLDERGVSGLLADYLEARDELVAGGADVVADELPLLSLFADIAELGRNRPSHDEPRTEHRVHSSREHLHTYLQSLDADRGGLPETFRARLQRVLAHYGVTDLDRTPELEDAVFRIFLSQQRAGADVEVATTILRRWLAQDSPSPRLAVEARQLLERMVRATQLRFPAVGDLARSVRFRWFDQPLVDAERRSVLGGVGAEVEALVAPDAPDRAARIEALTNIPEQIVDFLAARMRAGVTGPEPLLEVLIRRHYREYQLHDVAEHIVEGRSVTVAEYNAENHGRTRLVTTVSRHDELRPGSALDAAVSGRLASDHDNAVEIYLSWPGMPEDPELVSAELIDEVARMGFAAHVRRVVVAVCPEPGRQVGYFTLRREASDFVEDTLVRGMHPGVGRRLNLRRLREFDVTRLDAPNDVLLYDCVARENPADRRLVAMAQVRQLAVVRDEEGRVVGLPHAERAVENCLEAIRRVRTSRGDAGSRLDMNHVWVTVWPVVEADLDQLTALQDKITPLSEGAGIEEVLAIGRIRVGEGADSVAPIAIRFHARPGAGVVADVELVPTEPLKPLDDYAAKVVRSRRRGLAYPSELAPLLAGGGSLVEHDLDDQGRLVPVERPYGENKAGIITAVVTTPTPTHPQGVKRVVLCGDPTKALGAVSEAECTRIIAAIDLADEMGVPVEWFALSAGARISMDSGTENMDWVAAALKRIVEFTQAGGEINVVVAGINVGAQPYWNAEATMLMHTRGILVMTPDSAMVLTGKQSLDFSGGVSAEDNFGIGGYDRVMGPNGQAQYWAPDLAGAMEVLLQHYDHTYIEPGEARPRRVPTTDAADRDVSDYPHPAEIGDFTRVGEIFSATSNPDRKKPFDIRTVMRALTDQDHGVLERWAGMADAETAVTWDARIGGIPVSLVGIESRPIRRRGFAPTDGPDTYTAGTLFPRSSKKVARAINAASGNRPVVVLANLSGFDGSPDSMRNLQLEYGAEIGRSIVNFRGPIVFCVISRYHGGAFVVFSKRLNPSMTVLAIEGSYASVLGGAPAAAVVFSGEVDRRAAADPRVAALRARIDAADDAERATLLAELPDLQAHLRAEKISEVAAEFDGVHNIHRAVDVGSVDEVISATRLRPRVIEALEAGLA
jgi:acetyl-CoA carboxylase carboxyltransferase component